MTDEVRANPQQLAKLAHTTLQSSIGLTSGWRLAKSTVALPDSAFGKLSSSLALSLANLTAIENAGTGNEALVEVYESVQGSSWVGAAADSYHAHRTKLGGVVEEVAASAEAMAGALDTVASWLTSGQETMDGMLAELSATMPVTVGAEQVTFQPRTSEEAAAAGKGITESYQGLLRYDGEMMRCVAEVDAAAARLANATAAWSPDSPAADTGWLVPPEATAAGGVIWNGKEVVINTGTGDDDVVIEVDPVTGEQVVTVNGVSSTYPPGVQIVLRSGPGNDTITVPPGTGLNLVLVAGDGDDRIASGDAKDVILGLGGEDRIEAGAGDDLVSGGLGRDYLDGGGGHDVLTGGAGDDTLYGLVGNDVLTGGSGQDYLEGGAGKDEIDGGSGSDMISGGRGNDTIRGGADGDTVYTGAGKDQVDGGSQSPDTGGGTRGDTVYSQPTDSATGVERAVTVEISDPLKHIVVSGSPEFTARVMADLDMLRSSPRGQEMLAALETGGTLAPPDYKLTITELTEDNGGYYPMPTTTIEYNPRFTAMPGLNMPPVTVLFHEMSHAYDDKFTGFDDTLYQESTGEWVPNGERSAAGLPIDHDGDPATPDIIDPAQPFELTENGLRDELGWPLRKTYSIP